MSEGNKIEKIFDASKIKRQDDRGIQIILGELLHSRDLRRRLLIVTANW
jgi:hypothetical protein